MEEVLITYPSKNATSREAAFSLARGFEEAGSNVNLESPSSILAEKLKDYDLIVVMGSTRGCLHCEVCKNCPLKEMRIFLYRMSHGIKLTGLRAVVIGLHPSSHHAMKATKIFTKALQKVKMQVIYQETLPPNLSNPLHPQTT